MLSSVFLFSFWFCSSLLCCLARDTLTTTNSLIRDFENETLVSQEKKFQLGFFTPNGSSRRYLGIWYYSSYAQTIVWVANRDNPLQDDSGIFTLVDGNLQVIDQNKKSYWSTNLDGSSKNIKVRLMDTGNLVIIIGDQENSDQGVLWTSFDNPTDTFLPGMKMNEDMTLTSWDSSDDPRPGNFTFQLDQDGLNQFIISKRSIKYWKSGVSGKFTGFDQMPPIILYLLTNFTSDVMPNYSVPKYSPSYYNVTRLIMSFSGQIQFYRWQDEKIWTLVWAAPRDRCTVYNTCGTFGSCNNKNNVLCKCLPGFNPTSPENWRIGDFSGGCSRNSEICTQSDDAFLKLNMMKVGNPDSQFNAKSSDECRLECLNNCQCVAYSYEEIEIAERGNASGACSIWSDDLRNLQEEYDGGRAINVRVAVSYKELRTRTCAACGSNTIPYPLSTSPSCGDQMYSSFHCNTTTGQVDFQAPNGTYRVTIINPDTRTFVIQTKEAGNCGDAKSRNRVLQLNQSFPFNVTSWCNNNFSMGASMIGEDEIEITWKVPKEPTCSTQNDCVDLPNSLCNETGEGKKKCLCDIRFKWDGLSLNCSRVTRMYRSPRVKLPLSMMIVVGFTCLTALIVSSTILYMFMQRRKLIHGQVRNPAALQLYGSERPVKELTDSSKFKEDNTEGIPFFDLESIQVATKNFSNVNKLGQGGFGPVYKGIFRGGQEIAVKRLSRCSGQGQVEFKNEVVLIAKLQHRNLVRLLGYCVEGEEKMLLYEYMPNKSLDSFIFDRKLCLSLNWEKRYNIILGIARGLVYLHQDSRLRIIHRDLKTSNILLDEEMSPKISDFGLARIFGDGKETAMNTNRVVGTYGYMSPEYALDGLFSFKSDVFSFGVVVLEILSGKRNTGFYQPEKSLSLLGYAWHLWKEEKSIELLDSCLIENCKTREFLKCVTVGLLCVQEDPSDRPTMSNVVFMLGSEIASIQAPKQPAFVVRRCRSSSSSRQETFSNNELTITLEDGR